MTSQELVVEEVEEEEESPGELNALPAWLSSDKAALSVTHSTIQQRERPRHRCQHLHIVTPSSRELTNNCGSSSDTASTFILRYRVFFYTGPPPKSSKYKKVNLG